MENNMLTPNIQMTIDTSSLTTTSLTEDQFKNNLVEPLQDILDKTFDIAEKRRIKFSPTSINFACPFCHDSATDMKKKRAHLILKGKFAGRFKCHNCGMTMSIQKFFSDFNRDLSLSEITYIKKELPQDSSYYMQMTNSTTSNVVNSEEAYKWALDRSYFRDALGLLEISKTTSPVAYNYLVGRCQYTHYERFLYSDKYNQLIILNLVNDRVLGAQIRNLGNTNGPKYLTLTIEKMRQSILGDHTPIPEAVSNLSCVFNIFNVDFIHTYQMPVLVTEGPFDAFLLPNCIALSGASKGFAMNFPFWYVYDNDPTGVEHSLEVLRNGYKTFMWKKFKQDYGIPDINPYIAPGSNRRKWDVTDVMKYLRDNKVEKKLYWSPYFTNNSLDGLNI